MAAAAALYAMAAGTLTLLGWALPRPRLTDWMDTGITMKANPSLAAILAGAAVLVLAIAPRQKLLVRMLAVVVALTGGLTLAEHVLRMDLGIDTLLFDEPPGAVATMAPGRMGPPASLSFLLLGLGLCLGGGTPRARRAASAIGTVVLALAALSLVGYLYGVRELYGLARVTGISFQMATMSAALAIGLIAALPDSGLAEVMRRDDAGGAMVRRILLPMVAVSLLLGWMRLQGEHLGLYDTVSGTAVRTLLEFGLFLALLWWTANALSRQARGLRESEERERAARMEAETANRLKDQFLATVSHELRAPLNAILGWIHLLRKETAPREMVASGLEVIERNARVQSKLIADLLDVSRIVSGKLRLELQPLDLRRVVETALEAMEPAAAAKGVHLAQAIDPGTFPTRGDPGRLQQVVGNLLSNALKFTPSGGTVAVALHRAGAEVEVRVQDTGKGIRQEFLPHVFDRFRQEDATTSRAHGGLGLGLSIVKQLVDLHGGTVVVWSAGDGAGATFTIRLPLTAEAPTDALALDGRLVLVVDDEADAREVLAGLLRECGADVTAVGSARAALEAIRGHAPDLVVSDLAMPDGDGYALLEEVRRRGYGMPAIAVTAFARPEDRERARRAGYQRHVAKPVEPDELYDAVKLLLDVERRHGAEDPGPVRGR
ncbi:MAG TPA: ATP-binding protein [Candidatus Polarisedimenticolaceae bacterium]|nr:ATP-binding protein [Candidatus Polarisedimenticolaceae bacterium]